MHLTERQAVMVLRGLRMVRTHKPPRSTLADEVSGEESTSAPPTINEIREIIALLQVQISAFNAIVNISPRLESLTVAPDDLVDVVRQAAIAAADDANRKGLVAQIAFLVYTVGEVEARKRLEDFLS